ncbi:MAG TPA: DUF488 domain-containing protein [Acetobacteraceae bacterium]|nr:DUF488 domain-containing protein [Acetobacteraceae bacterium]
MLTIGHSTLPLETFLTMLEREGVAEVADVRSAPFSRRVPHFNRDDIRAALKGRGIGYVFLGEALGGRPQAGHLYCEGVADYEKMALEPRFLGGIDRVIGNAQKHATALMCAEHNPLDCHRCLLIGRALSERHVSVGHILNDGTIAGQRDVEEKLLALAGSATDDMFASREESLAKAYRVRAMKVAYRGAA